MKKLIPAAFIAVIVFTGALYAYSQNDEKAFNGILIPALFVFGALIVFAKEFKNNKKPGDL